MWTRKQEYQYYIGQMMINCILMYFVIYQKGINKPLSVRCSMQISYCFIKSNVNSVLVLVVVSKVFFHNDSPFFNKVMSSSGNVWVVLRIQQICNTTRHKSPIYGLFTLSKRQFQFSKRQYFGKENIKSILHLRTSVPRCFLCEI